MKTQLFLSLCIAVRCVAQFPGGSAKIPLIRGEVVHTQSLIGNQLAVELADPQAHRVVDRSWVDSDGHFEFKEVVAGMYELRLVAMNGDLVASQPATVQNGEPVSIQLPERQSEGPGGTVSAARLRHQPPKKAFRLAVAAQRDSARKDFARATAEWQQAIEIDPEFAVAHGNLGTQLLVLHQPALAEPELRRAVELDPGTAAYSANLAFALISLRKSAEAEEPARRAVRLDPANPRHQYVLGYALAQFPERRMEAVPHLKLAADTVPHAHVLLAQIYGLAGNLPDARAEIERYAAASPDINPHELEKWKAALR